MKPDPPEITLNQRQLDLLERRQKRHQKTEEPQDRRQLIRNYLNQPAPLKDQANEAALHAKARFKKRAASHSGPPPNSQSNRTQLHRPLQLKPKPRVVEDENRSVPLKPPPEPRSSSLSPVDREFNQFTETLSKEVMGPHSHLYKAFSDVLQNRPVELSTKMVMQSTPFKFDQATKDQLLNMHHHVKKLQVPVAQVTHTQVVNNKKWLRERKRAAQGILQKSKSRDSSEAVSEASSTTVSSVALTQISTVDSIMQFRSHSRDSSVKDVILQKKANHDPILQARSDDDALEEPPSLKSKERPSLKRVSDHRNMESILSKVSSETDSAVEVTLEPRPKLKRTSIQNEQSSTPPFAKVQLRKTNRPSLLIRTSSTTDSNDDTTSKATGQSDSPSTKDQNDSLSATEEVIESEANTESTENVSEKEVTAPESSASSPRSDRELMPPPPVPRQSSIPEPQNEKIDEAVVFRLKDDLKMIVGKKLLMLAKGDKEATIIWKMNRESVEGLNLDTNNFEVTLLMKKDPSDLTKTLSFRSWKDFIRFVNAFDGKEDEADVTQDDDTETVETNPFAGLTEEEQTVLEKYRELRRSQAPEQALDAALPVHEKKEDSSTKDDAVSEKYRKMLKLNIPEEAVRHKMKMDGFDESFIATVFDKPKAIEFPDLPSSPVSTMSSSVALSKKDLEMAASYSKMLNAKIPVDSIRSQMEYDKVDPRIIAHVLDDAAAASEAQETAKNSLSDKEQEAVSKYKKMLSFGIPPPAVGHKMRNNGETDKVIEAVLGALAAKPKAPQPETIMEAPRKTVLSEEEKTIASTYRKMMKAGLPKHLVEQRMKSDGVKPEIIKNVVGKLTEEAKEPKDSKSGGTSKLLPLHWTPLSGNDLDDSTVWTASRHTETTEIEPEGSDISKLINIFQKKTNKAADRQRDAKQKASDGGKAQLMDLTRAQNVSISLKAFKEFTYPDLADIIRYLDAKERLRGEKVQFVKDLLPTLPEVKLIKGYVGTPDRLVPAEIWFQHIVDIKRIETKANILRTIEMFDSEVESLSENFRVLYEVSHQVMDSEKLRDVLSMVLRIGNIMNEGTRSGGAAGFKFDSLLRLTQTKSSDGKTTVLDFLVQVFVEKGKRNTLDLLPDFPQCQAASRMVVSELLSNVKELSSSLKQCEDELEELRKEAKPPKETTSADYPRQSLLAAIRGEEESEKITRGRMRDRFLEAVKEKQESETRSSVGVSDVGIPERPNTLQGAISRLQEFVVKARKGLKELELKRDSTAQACRDLAKYCAESGGVQSATSVLGVLAEFAANIDSSLKLYDQRQESQERKARRTDGAGDPKIVEKAHPQTTDENNHKSLVLMVNELLKDAPERVKEDFKKGRVAPDAGPKLKAVYEKELRLKQFGSPQKPRKTIDIVTAIQQQQHDTSIAFDDEERARTQFRKQSPSGTDRIQRPETNLSNVASSQKNHSALNIISSLSAQSPILKNDDGPTFDLSASRDRLIRKSVGVILSPSQSQHPNRRLSAPSPPAEDHLSSPPRRLLNCSGEKKSLLELAKAKRTMRQSLDQGVIGSPPMQPKDSSDSLLSPSDENVIPKKPRKSLADSSPARPSIGQLAREKRQNRRKTMGN